ncbi:erythromycin esterase family protein [Polynucleobacter sp. MWH-UH23A]|uniref:erythromycin esterase family protein n=1 Tax=Polynucleobacter sp. MWH-UH23A TaxID=1855613 RepID=UPI003364F06E
MVDLTVIDASAKILDGKDGDYDALMKQIGGSRIVLLGEASHGTAEFYRERIRITQRLIVEKGFTAVVIEGDWPDAYRVNRYVRSQSNDSSADEALSGFKRFPTWMWRNTEVLRFVEWLHRHNDSVIFDRDKVGFFGIDLYSLFTSIDEVLKYLDKVDPPAAIAARERYACFDHFDRSSELYGYSQSVKGAAASCEPQVVAQLVELYRKSDQYLAHKGAEETDALFYAQQNARLIKNAEEYYRNMFNRSVSSWNMRDQHMAEILVNLDRHITDIRSEPSKIIVWAHNSHLGDARATEMGERGELNVGQLMRQTYGREVYSVGFTTYHGTVTAASDWGAPVQRKRVRQALHASYENYFHQVGINTFYLPIKNNYLLHETLSYEAHLERAIGVIYSPNTERHSHYFHANLSKQFDSIIHIDESHALKPLELTSHWINGESPETYPRGL